MDSQRNFHIHGKIRLICNAQFYRVHTYSSDNWQDELFTSLDDSIIRKYKLTDFQTSFQFLVAV